MRRALLAVGLIVVSLVLVLACGKQEEPAKAQKPEAKNQAPARQEAVKPPPPAKEPGKDANASLQVYDEPNMAIKTEYPDTMTVVGTGSGEGSGFIFTFKPRGNALDQAKVHIFLPRGAASAATQEPFVTGPRGLLATNGWKKDGETTDAGKFSYGWVRKVISFADPGNRGMVGQILLGETGGQAVEIILYYPTDLRDEFLTNARLILGRLSFKSDKLPLGKSQ